MGQLANYGGPTQTHALLASSPATDAGNPTAPGSGGLACAALDQRGFARPDLHRQQGDQDAAEHSFRRAIDLARDHGTRWWELRATTSLARLPLGRSQPAARDALGVLLISFTEGFDTTDLVQAQRVLAALR